MTDKAAFKASYADFKIVKGRQQAQFVLEVPLEEADAALKALGGLPRPDQERWVAVAVLDMKAVQEPKPKRQWHELPRSQQAALACEDARFREWIVAGDAEQAAVKVRRHCLVSSRALLDTDKDSAALWDRLYTEYREKTGMQTERRA
jgi:hypothetical protein